MSVQRAGNSDLPISGEADNYDELIVQTVHASPEVDLSGTNGQDWPANGKWGPFVLAETTPLGGRLERNQVAELVSVHLDSHVAMSAQTSMSGTTPGTGIAEVELNRPDRDTVVDGPPDAMDLSALMNNPPSGVNEGDMANVKESNVYTEVSYDEKIVFSAVGFGTPFNDSANSAGGGGTTGNATRTHELLRRWYGRGPVMWGDDLLRLGGTVTYREIEDEGIRLNCRCRLVWDVFETEEPQYRETAGPDIGV